MAHILGRVCFLKLSISPREKQHSAIFSDPRRPVKTWVSPVEATKSSQMPRPSPQMPRQSPQMPRQSPYMPWQSPQMPRQSPYMPWQSPYIPRQSPHMPGQPADIGEWPAGFSRLITQNMRQGAYRAMLVSFA